MKELRKINPRTYLPVLFLAFLIASIFVITNNLERTEEIQTEAQAAEMSIGGTDTGLQYDRSSYPPDTGGTCFGNFNNLIGQGYASSVPKYHANRTYLVWFTQNVPDDATITGATLDLIIYSTDYNHTATDFTLNIWGKSGGYNPGSIGCEDWQSSFSGYTKVGTYWTGNLPGLSAGEQRHLYVPLNNDSSYAWINKTAQSGVVLTSSREEANNTPSGEEWFKIYKYKFSHLIVTYTIPPPPDTTPPSRSNRSPSGTLSAGTTSTTMSLKTNEGATCKYATSSGVSYNSMPYTFSTTGGTSHSKTVTGLSNGKSYNYYVRCRDSAGNANTNDYTISFSVASPPPDDDGNGDKPPPDDGGGGTTPPPPGDGLPSLPPPPASVPGVAPTIDPNIVNYLKVEVSVPYLLGKITVPTQIGGYSHELEITPGKNEYSIDLRGAKFSLGKLLSIATGGSKTLTKKLKITSKAPKQPAKLGQLDLGDITGDNKINEEDMAYYLKSLSNQTKEGEINADGEVNSLDWAILLVNFGKIGDR